MSKTNGSEIFEHIQCAAAQHIGYGGQRQTLEDRYAACQMKTAAGQSLFVGAVADGIGGAKGGEIAAQLTIDTILRSIHESNESDLHAVLNTAIQNAHLAVRTAGHADQDLRGMGTTASVAAIAGGKLYLAHIGDSRAYLVRGSQLLHLTMDHSWGNEKVREGLLSLEEAKKHQRSGELARYVGANLPSLNIDLGLRLENEADPSKSKLRPEPLALEAGDVVLLCSDGLIKDRPNLPGHFVEEAEIVNCIQHNNPQDAANTLLSLALGRQVDDNVSVVVMEAPGKRKRLLPAAPAGLPRLALPLLLGGLALALLFVVGLFALLLGGRGGLAGQASLVPLAAQLTATPLPQHGQVKLLSGQINYQVGNQQPGQAGKDQTVPIGGDVRLWTGNQPARLWLEDGSVLALDGSTTAKVQAGEAGTPPTLFLERGRALVLAGSPQVQPKDGSSGIIASANNSFLGTSVDLDGTFTLDCLGPQAPCLVLAGPGGPQTLVPGQSLSYPNGVMGPLQGANYDDWLALGAGDLPAPTATPVPTATEIPTLAPVNTALTPAPAVVATQNSGKDPNKDEEGGRNSNAPQNDNDNGGGNDNDNSNDNGGGHGNP